MEERMVSTMERLDTHRHQVEITSGPVSYIDTGGPGRPALFVHGLATSSYLWRNVIELIDGERRCVAFDLPLHGSTPAPAGQDFSLPGLAGFLRDCCDALDLADIDLVGNDTGGAICQAFAAAQPSRLHTLTLTNCEAHKNLPPKLLLPATVLARAGLTAGLMTRLMRDVNRGRKMMYGSGYEDLASLPADVARAWLEPLFGTSWPGRTSASCRRCTPATCSRSSRRWRACRSRR
jgi:pimeloyl-ACP methyl ester carboxylesterase